MGLVPVFFISCLLYLVLPAVVILSMRPPSRPVTPIKWKKLAAPPKHFIEGEYTVVKAKKEPAMSKKDYN